jgi:hypothetical protein
MRIFLFLDRQHAVACEYGNYRKVLPSKLEMEKNQRLLCSLEKCSGDHKVLFDLC